MFAGVVSSVKVEEGGCSRNEPQVQIYPVKSCGHSTDGKVEKNQERYQYGWLSRIPEFYLQKIIHNQREHSPKGIKDSGEPEKEICRSRKVESTDNRRWNSQDDRRRPEEDLNFWPFHPRQKHQKGEYVDQIHRYEKR